ncbi:MAG: hypothetical protein PHU63_03605 [Candidatus ainarchaeum sp.]|nr:hypothetical protein [Candidatus ainarchaeum sp.]
MDYKDWKTKKPVEVKDLKNFEFPSTGAKILLKARPPIAKECSAD